MNLKRYIGTVIVFAGSPLLGARDSQESEWRFAEEKSRNAVIQVWSQSVEYDWIYPYKSPEQRQGAGSGFFIDSRGYFLTNYHVVARATSIYVSLPVVGRSLFPAKIVGVCPELDVALLELTEESKSSIKKECGAITALEFGDSDALYETQPVLALGFPLGLRTLKSTVGAIAGRDFLDGRSFIHSTAPINPGNSGGPLLTTQGKVVGINTSAYKNSQNYNYVVPSNEIKVVLDELFKKPLVRRPDVTGSANHSTEAHARSLGNPLPAGLYTNYVYKGSMEEKAGLKVGDMMYEIKLNGIKYQIDEYGYVSVRWRRGEKISIGELLVRCHVGDPITLVIYRNGSRKELTCNFETPALNSVRVIYPEYEPDELDYEIFGGLVIMQLRINHLEPLLAASRIYYLKELNEYKHLENHSKPALVITAVLAGSVSYLSECFAPGFILETVNGKTVTNLSELREALMLSATSGEIAITTKDRSATVLNLHDVLEGEQPFAETFMYPLSETIKKLMIEYKKPTK